MSTRSTIAYHNPNTGRVEQVYCHSDGYLSGVGQMLLEHYSNESDAMNTVREGDMSVLGPTMKESVVYRRDRGEKWCFVQPDVFENMDYLLVQARREKYNYVFTNGEWHMISPNNDLVPLNHLIRA